MICIRLKYLLGGMLILACCSVPLSAMSLFHEDQFHSLITDYRGNTVGDVLTVLIIESAQADSEASLASAKKITTNLSAGYQLNRQELHLGIGGQGDNRGSTRRNGHLKAAMTVTICQQINPHLFLVQGQQRIQINGELQRITLRGKVRSEDISPDNTILSTRIADADIQYQGQGSVGQGTHFNPVFRFFSMLGLL